MEHFTFSQLGEQLRLARQRAQLSQDGLAQLAGVCSRTVIRLEQGRMVSLRSLLLVLTVLEGDCEAVTALSHRYQRR